MQAALQSSHDDARKELRALLAQRDAEIATNKVRLAVSMSLETSPLIYANLYRPILPSKNL